MYFSAQPLPTAAHHYVGQVAVPNVSGDRSFTNVQFVRRFLNRKQPFVIIRRNQFRRPLKMEAAPPGRLVMLKQILAFA
jgi:hypothetical protein